MGRDSDREDPRSRLRDETLRIEYPLRISHGTVRLGRTTSLHSLEFRTGDQQREVRLTPRGRWKSNPTLGRNYLGAPQDGSASGP